MRSNDWLGRLHEKTRTRSKNLMRPVVLLLEKRLEEMLMMAYEEGYKDGVQLEATLEESEKMDVLSRQVAQADMSQVRCVVEAAYILGKGLKIV